jgi:glycopeptide antibiotics resistance protein
MSSRQRRLGYRLAAVGLVFIGLLTLFPDPEAAARAASTPLSCILCGDQGGVDFFLNILLFLPLGLGLALAGFSWRRALILAALLSCSIELLQMKVIVGRDASLGDVISNTLGGGIGALLGACWRRFVFPVPKEARHLALVWALCLVWVWAGTAWAFGPTWPVGSPWYGQWAPDLGGYKPFLGTLLMVTAGGEPLLPGRAIDQGRIEDAVAADPAMAVRAVVSTRPRGMAPLGAIYDGRQRQVMLLAQDHQDLAFAIRTRATILKLQSPRVNLKDGMAGPPGDTVDAEGALRDGAFELSSRDGQRVVTRRLPLSASWGWSLVTPWKSVLGEEVHGLTALWIVGLVALLAYWSLLAGGLAVTVIPVTITVLLGAIPYAAGFPPVDRTEWAAALAGVGMGWVCAVAARNSTALGETLD